MTCMKEDVHNTYACVQENSAGAELDQHSRARKLEESRILFVPPWSEHTHNPFCLGVNVVNYQ
jgi:hypothetical protein